MSNYTDPNQVYETGSDDTFWNSKVIRVGERFNVQVFDADGDRRPDREDSFADQALAIAFAGKSVQRYSGREVGISRFDSSKPFMVGMLEFAEIADAVDAAAAASRLKENAFSAQICQALQKGVYGYQGSSVAIAYFKHGRDLDELAADEDGVPDFDRRSKAFRPRNLSNYTDKKQQGVPGVMTKIVYTFFVTHGLGRADTSTADADAIVQKVNASTAGSGDSLSREAVQKELDDLATPEIQALYRLTVESTPVEVEEEPEDSLRDDSPSP